MMLKARRALRYAGKSILKGGVFDAKPADGRLLVAASIADEYVEPVKPVPAAVKQRVDAMTENGSITETQAEQVLEHHATKRAYKRRDMTAE